MIEDARREAEIRERVKILFCKFKAFDVVLLLRLLDEAREREEKLREALTDIMSDGPIWRARRIAEAALREGE